MSRQFSFLNQRRTDDVGTGRDDVKDCRQYQKSQAIEAKLIRSWVVGRQYLVIRFLGGEKNSGLRVPRLEVVNCERSTPGADRIHY